MKTSKLTGPALDWAVAKCEAPIGGYKAWVQADLDKGILHGMCYSSDWLWGGPIIERENMCVNRDDSSDEWGAHRAGDDFGVYWGLTPLIAAMRCYVASVLGEEVDVPEGLAQ